MKYTMTSPCPDCPFRKDRPFPLMPGRPEGIRDSLRRGEFPCHKTVDYAAAVDQHGNEDLDNRDSEGEFHCAGALILLEKLQKPSQMMRICERIGMYDASKLDMDAPVYDSWPEMVKGTTGAMRGRK